MEFMGNLGALHGEFYIQYCVLKLSIEAPTISMTRHFHKISFSDMKFGSSLSRTSNPYIPVNSVEADEQFQISLNIHFWPYLELHV